MSRLDELKTDILAKMAEYERLRQADESRPFRPGVDRVNYAGRWYGPEELVSLGEAALEFWLTYGRFSRRLEQDLAARHGARACLLVNSGSSANLLALASLTSPLLKDRALRPGDEVITTACGFPTTCAPIVQLGLRPVFVDVALPGANLNPAQLEAALGPRTRAVMAAHTLGNPFDLAAVSEFCERHGLWLVEDNCDALGGLYAGRPTGSWGHLASLSFYPAHHITTGEGGAVLINDGALKRPALSLRDWGRDCWCDSGRDDTCQKRFGQQHGSLPFGYDHKYVYSHFGYNLKMTDLQAAVGCAQIERLDEVVRRRRENHAYLHAALADWQDYFILPQATQGSEPSWFGFLLTVRAAAPFGKQELVEHLEAGLIQTRQLFGGNLVRQPLFSDLAEGRDYRLAAPLRVTDRIMHDSFWIGVHPGLDRPRLDYMIARIRAFAEGSGA
ncbi:MAG: lipopolysaccharide biosynthesis protein RfbH [Thermodesulfobacteriota bacterium]